MHLVMLLQFEMNAVTAQGVWCAWLVALCITLGPLPTANTHMCTCHILPDLCHMPFQIGKISDTLHVGKKAITYDLSIASNLMHCMVAWPGDNILHGLQSRGVRFAPHDLSLRAQLYPKEQQLAIWESSAACQAIHLRHVCGTARNLHPDLQAVLAATNPSKQAGTDPSKLAHTQQAGTDRSKQAGIDPSKLARTLASRLYDVPGLPEALRSLRVCAGTLKICMWSSIPLPFRSTCSPGKVLHAMQSSKQDLHAKLCFLQASRMSEIVL